jgi:CDP-diacylglycerol--glycerol-3-phosphate 3-phosphatidyltransferase
MKGWEESNKMNLPNKLTISRIILTPFVIIIILSDLISSEYRYYVASCFFLMVCFTDFLDGRIARRKNPESGKDSVTDFGILTDPIADKILILSTLMSLVYLRAFSPYVFVILFGRDIIMTWFRLIAIKVNSNIKESKTVPASFLGKTKTVMEIIMILFILLDLRNSWPAWIKSAIICTTVILALSSMAVYIIKDIDIFHKIEK